MKKLLLPILLSSVLFSLSAMEQNGENDDETLEALVTSLSDITIEDKEQNQDEEITIFTWLPHEIFLNVIGKALTIKRFEGKIEIQQNICKNKDSKFQHYSLCCKILDLRLVCKGFRNRLSLKNCIYILKENKLLNQKLPIKITLLQAAVINYRDLEYKLIGIKAEEEINEIKQMLVKKKNLIGLLIHAGAKMYEKIATYKDTITTYQFVLSPLGPSSKEIVEIFITKKEERARSKKEKLEAKRKNK